VPAPQAFDVTLPTLITPGIPAGAGNLESTASEDRYVFTTPADGGVQVDFSACSSSLGYNVDWKIIDTATGAALYSASGCGSKLVPGLPAGQYRLALTRNGHTGTYAVAISLQPSPEYFNVLLPTTISNGVPDDGAGNLETPSSQDNYRFTTGALGGVQVDFASCSASLSYNVTWALVDETTAATLFSTTGCASKLVTDVPAGQYKLVVTRNGMTGTYQVGILVQPPAQVFNVSLPVSVSNGVPSAGAGNLETTASQDEYTFTTSTTGTFQAAFSACSAGLGFAVTWKLVNTATGATIFTTTACTTKTISALAPGSYRVVVTRNGGTGTYALGLSSGP